MCATKASATATPLSSIERSGEALSQPSASR
jgi:hypothetical protein